LEVILFKLQINVERSDLEALESEPGSAAAKTERQVALEPGFKGFATSAKEDAGTAVQEVFNDRFRFRDWQLVKGEVLVFGRPRDCFLSEERVSAWIVHGVRGFMGWG
jgi:hypothetical protein